MYKISKIFLSGFGTDSVTVDNMLIDFNNDAPALLLAPNGTCKTTCLSMIMTIFDPDAKHFIQTASNASHKLDDYLSNKSATISAVEFEAETPGDLIAEKKKILVGTIMQLNKPRIFFSILGEKDALSQIAENWDKLSSNMEDIRHYLRDSNADVLPQQNKWKTHLNKLGIDSSVMRLQSIICQAEGGIESVGMIESESNFLKLFCSYAASPEDNIAIEKALEEAAINLKNQPTWISQQQGLKVIKSKLEESEKACLELVEMNAQRQDHAFRQASFVMSAQDAKSHLEKLLGCHQEDINKLSAEVKAQEEQLLEARKLDKIRRLIAMLVEISESKSELELQKQNQNDILIKISTIKHRLIKDSYDQLCSQKTVNDKLIEKANSQLAVLTTERDCQAMFFHRAGKAEIENIALPLPGLKEKKQALNAKIDELANAQEKLLADIQLKQSQNQQLAKTIQKAENSLDDLADGRKDFDINEESATLKQAIKNNKKDLKTNMRLQEEANQKVQSAIARQKLIETEVTNNKIEKIGIDEKLQNQAAQLKSLSALESVQTFFDGEWINPFSKEFLVAIERHKNKFQKTISEDSELLNEYLSKITKLENTLLNGGAGISNSTANMLSYLRDNDFSITEVRTWPDFLQNHPLYSTSDNPAEKIAAIIHGNPARYTGLWVKDLSTMDRIKDLGAPKGLDTPVLASLPDSEIQIEILANNLTIFTPDDPQVYTPDHLRRRIENLENLTNPLGIKIQELKERLKTVIDVERAINDYCHQWQSNDNIDSLKERQFELEMAIQRSQQDIDKCDEAIANGREDQKRIVSDREKLIKKSTTLNGLAKRITKWLEENGQFKQWKYQYQVCKDDIANLQSRRKIFTDKITPLEKDLDNIKIECERIDREIAAAHRHINSIGIPMANVSEESIGDRSLIDTDTHANNYYKAKSAVDYFVADKSHEKLAQESAELQKRINEEDKKMTAFDSLKIDMAYSSTLTGGEQMKLATLKNLEQLEIDKRNEIATSSAALKSLKAEAEAFKSEHAISEVDDEFSYECAAQTPEGMAGPDLFALKLQISESEGHIKKMEAELESIKQEASNLATASHGMKDCYTELDRCIQYADTESEAYGEFPLKDMFGANFTTLAKVDSGQAKFLASTVNGLITRSRTLDRQIQKFEEDINIHREEIKRAISQTDSIEKNLGHFKKCIDDNIGISFAEVAVNMKVLIEANIESTQNSIDGSTTAFNEVAGQLLNYGKSLWNALKRASKIKIPQSATIHAGKKIIIARMNDCDIEEDRYLNDFKDYLMDILRTNRIPDVNTAAGNLLGCELLYRIQRLAGPRRLFDIEILKCNDSNDSKHESAEKVTGSGGERITAGLLIYTVILKIRSEATLSNSACYPSFLIQDNPMAKCSHYRFLQMQLETAKALGLQMIAFAPVEFKSTSGMFPNAFVMTKDKTRKTYRRERKCSPILCSNLSTYEA